jgi:hypothetical protein
MVTVTIARADGCLQLRLRIFKGFSWLLSEPLSETFKMVSYGEPKPSFVCAVLRSARQDVRVMIPTPP